jgi:hypothetical protein
VRDLGFSSAKFVRLIGAVVCAAVAAGGATADATAGPSPVTPRTYGPAFRTYGPARAWGGTEIRSLDPVRLGGNEFTASTTPGSTPKPPGSAPKHHGTAPKHPAHRDQILSNERTFTRWAYVNQILWIHQAPSTSSRHVGKLTWYTPDGFSSLYLLLRLHWDAHGQQWVKLRIPGRPNGRTGWVERGALGPFHLNHLLVVVNREQLRMTFYDNGRQIWSAPVGVGQPSMPTPTGHFWIDERFNIGNPGSGYYPFAFGTTDYSTLTDWPGGGVVGIHGPYYDAAGIPGYISHGCIRLHVPDDFWFAGHVQLGTPLHVV